MPTPFTVTATTNSVQLDASRRGETAFTVFNASGRPIRGQARLAPQNPAAAAWLSLAGEAERDFAIAGAQQYTVQINVPPDAPGGNYPFRLDVVGVENPDEQYAQGPTVTFQVPEPKPKKPFPWWILLVVAAGVLLIGGAIAAIVLWPREVEVPVVESGSTIGEVTDILTAANLEVADGFVEEPSAEVAEDRVIRTDPPAGDEVPRGSEITLVVSTGPETVEIPDFVYDRTEADARAILEEACERDPCLEVEVRYEYSDAVDPGRVIGTEPEMGSEVPQGSEVTLVVSSGPALVDVEMTADADSYWNPPGTPVILIYPPPDYGHSAQLVLGYSEEVPAGELFGPGGPGVVAIYFDLEQLPAGVTVEQATLHLFLEEGEEAGRQVFVQRATSAWDESRESARPEDCDATEQAAAEVGLTPGWTSWDVTAIIQRQHANPAENHGLCLKLSDVGRRVFSSREGAIGQRPYLALTYRRP